jgi:hypothetical protein
MISALKGRVHQDGLRHVSDALDRILAIGALLESGVRQAPSM